MFHLYQSSPSKNKHYKTEMRTRGNNVDGCVPKTNINKLILKCLMFRNVLATVTRTAVSNL